MAHEITIRENGKAEMAFTGPRSAIWHGLGSELDQNSTIDQWKVAAGMDWEIFESKLTYQAIGTELTFPDKRALFRSDTKKALSIVSDDYKIVQPGEVLEFFRDLVELHDMKLSTAGTLFGGKKFWALAELGKEFEVVSGDKINGHILLTTSADGSLATTAKFVSERVVCHNTLSIALNENSRNIVRKSHRSSWDPTSIKIDMDLLDKSWNNFMAGLKKIQEVKISNEDARQYFQKKLYNPDLSAEEQGWGAVRKVSTLMYLFENGAGAEFSRGTLYGVLNAATEMTTHGSGRRDANHQFNESEFGNSDKFKSEVYNDMLALAA